MKTAVLVPVLLCAACGDDGSANHATPDAATQLDASVPDSGTDVRHQSIELAGGANGLYWDDAAQTLFLTDDSANTFLKYTDAAGVQTVATLPAAAGSNPGGIARLADGTFVTPNFVMGQAGNTLFTIDATARTSKALTTTDPGRHRIGVGVNAAGDLYDAYFAGAGGGNPVGSIAKVTINADGTFTEAPLTTTTAFKKLVGLAVTADAVYVSDQTQGKIFKVALADSAVTPVASLTGPDLLTLLPNGDLISGGTAVHRVTAAGVDTPLFTTETFGAVRGSAYDPTHKRLFFINHSNTVGAKDHLEVRPLE